MSSSLFLKGKKGELVTTLALLSLVTIVFGTVLGTSAGVKSTVTKLFPQAAESCTFVNTLEVRGVNGTVFRPEDTFSWSSEVDNGFRNPGATLRAGSNPSLASLKADFPLGGTSNDFEGKKASVSLTVPEGFVVTSTFCEPSGGSTACEGVSTNAQKSAISGITLSCGGSIKYGWNVERGGIGSLPNPTTPPSEGSASLGTGTAEVRLFVLQGKAPSADFCGKISTPGGLAQLQAAADTNGRMEGVTITKYLATSEGVGVPIKATAVNPKTNPNVDFTKIDDRKDGFHIVKQDLAAGVYNFAAQIPENGSQLAPLCNDLKNNVTISNGATTPVPIVYYLTNQCRTDKSCTSEKKGIISGSGGRSRICCGAGVTPPPVVENPAPKACSAATCMYSQRDTDSVIRCYRGTCADGTENCSLAKGTVNQNCTFRQDCSVPAIQLYCDGVNEGKPVAGGRVAGTPKDGVPNPETSSEKVIIRGFMRNIPGCKPHKKGDDLDDNGCFAVYQAKYIGTDESPATDNIAYTSGSNDDLATDEIHFPKIYKGHRLNWITMRAQKGSKTFDGTINLLKNSSVQNCDLPHRRFTVQDKYAFRERCEYVEGAPIPDTLVFNFVGEGGPETSSDTGDTQLVPFEMKIHRSLVKSNINTAPTSVSIRSYVYPAWDNYTENGNTTIPDGGRRLNGFSTNVNPQGDYYVLDGAIDTPTSGWPTLSFGFEQVLRLPATYTLTRTNCVDISKDVALGRNGTYDYKSVSNPQINCFNVNANKITIKLDPKMSGNTPGPVSGPLIAKFKIDDQTIDNLDRIETQMCDGPSCETVITSGSQVKPFTTVSVPTIQGQAVQKDGNYELSCTLHYTDGRSEVCGNKSISVGNPGLTDISSGIFGGTTVVTKTQFEMADRNDDGKVTASDIAVLLFNFATARADINYDGKSDTLDLTSGFKWLGETPN